MMNRVPNFMAAIGMLNDKLHQAGHICGLMYDSKDKRHVDVRNQSLAEQHHSNISMFKTNAKVQTLEHTMFMLQKVDNFDIKAYESLNILVLLTL